MEEPLNSLAIEPNEGFTQLAVCNFLATRPEHDGAIEALAASVREEHMPVPLIDCDGTWEDEDGVVIAFSVEVFPPLAGDRNAEFPRRVVLRSAAPLSALLEFVGRCRRHYRETTLNSVPDALKDGVMQYTWDDYSWGRGTSQKKRPLDSIYLPAGVADSVLTDLTRFIAPATRARYRDLHIPYTRTYMLHGVAGCGKSSLVRLPSWFSLCQGL